MDARYLSGLNPYRNDPELINWRNHWHSAVPGTFLFTIKVTDTNGYVGQQAFSIAIAALIVSSGNSGYIF